MREAEDKQSNMMQERQGVLVGKVSVLEELDKGFSRTGVQSFALEGILGELQVLLTARTALKRIVLSVNASSEMAGRMRCSEVFRGTARIACSFWEAIFIVKTSTSQRRESNWPRTCSMPTRQAWE